MANLMVWSKIVSPCLPLNLFHNGTCCNPAAFPFTTDGALVLQTWPPQWPVAQQSHLRTLGRRLSLHPYLWHGIRLSVVSTPLSLFHFPLPVNMLDCSDLFFVVALYVEMKYSMLAYNGAPFSLCKKTSFSADVELPFFFFFLSELVRVCGFVVM